MIDSSRHELDEAIDRVAAQMVAAPGDDRMLQQVLAQLPERPASPWFLAKPVQLTAAAALVLFAFIYARAEREAAPIELRQAAVDAPVPSQPPRPRPHTTQAVTADSRLATPVSRLSSAMDRTDHERSLVPIDVIEPMELGAIAAPALELDAPASLEPLVLTDLSLATKGES